MGQNHHAIGDRWSVAAQTANYGWALHNTDEAEIARHCFACAAELFAHIGAEDRVEKYRRLAAEG